MPPRPLRHHPGSLVLALLAITALASTAAAQWIPTRAFGVHDGLAQSQVMALTHDRFGYLWLATQGGLSRFDGVSFTTFTVVEGLPDNFVTALAAGPSGELWVGTDSGQLARWDGYEFTSWAGPDPAHGAVIGLAAGDDDLLVATEAGLWSWRPERTSLLLERPVRQLVAVDDAGSGCRAWLVTTGLDCVTTDGAVLERLGGSTLGVVTAVAPEGAGAWLGTAGGAVLRVRPDGTLARPAQLRRAIRALAPASDGGAWLGAEDGLWRLHADGRVTRQPLVASDPTMEIRCLALDREGNLWVSPWSGGLFQLPAAGFAVFGRSSGFPTSEVWTFLEDPDGCMWMGTEDVGLLRWCEDGIASHLRPGRELPAVRIMSLARGGDGGLWAGTAAGVVQLAGGRLAHVWTRAEGLPDDYVRALLRDRAGRLWAATRQGLARFEGGRWRAWTVADGLPDDNLRALAEDDAGALWIATHGAGVVRFDGERFVTFGVAEGLPHDRVWSLAVDSGRRVWAGTDGGLWIHPLGAGPDRSVVAGLPSPNVLSLVEDRDGWMWVGTTRGVCRLDTDGVVDRVLTMHDGLAGSEAAESAVAIDHLGRLWLGTADGVTRLDPARLARNLVPPQVVLERVLVDGSPWPGPVPFAVSGRGEPAELRLGPALSDVRLEFTALSYTAPERVRYRFMLAGWDDVLSAPSDERHVTYRHLPPGRYRFVATACNSDGVWSSSPLELPLVVLPAWHQTWWFQFTLLLSVAAAVIGGFAVHSAGQRRRRAELEREVVQRTAELAEANRRIVGQNELLSELSRTDPLTGLGNRRVLAELLPLEMALIRRELLRQSPQPASYHGAAVLLLDLDHFKAVNDRWGHDVGDRVLRSVAEALTNALREVDLAVRWGGEEFVILARSIDRHGLEILARRLLAVVPASPVELADGTSVAVTASIGFVPYPLGFTSPLDGDRWQALFDLADRLMYLAKERGRDRACGLVWSSAGEASVADVELAHRAHETPTTPGPGLEFRELEPQG